MEQDSTRRAWFQLLVDNYTFRWWWWCGSLTDFLRQDFAALHFSPLRSWWWHESRKWMQRHKSNREGSQWTEWTPRSRRKNEVGKKALLVQGMCWTAWFIHGTERHHSFGSALTGWWWLRQFFCRHHERRLDQVTIHIQTSRKASNYASMFAEREKILKTWTIKTQTCHIKLSFPRWILNAHFTFKISMIDKCVKKVSAI